MQPRRVLVPINLPNISLETLLFAKEMACDLPVCLTLLNVVRLNIAFDSRIYDDLCLESEAALRQMRTRFFGAARAVCVTVRVGNPCDQIVAEAKSSRAELILLSSPARLPWKRLFGDGAVKGVVRTAPCPTLVLPRVWMAAPAHRRDAAVPTEDVSAPWLTSAPVCR